MTETLKINFKILEKKLIESRANHQSVKSILDDFQKKLDNAFHNGVSINDLLEKRSWIIDKILQSLWQQFFLTSHGICIIATGGYGRQELFPCSDIDILILYHKKLLPMEREHVASFISAAWDLNLKLGHGTRSFKSCFLHAGKDPGIYTSLLEMHFVAGDFELYRSFEEKFRAKHVWDGALFFMGKEEEKQRRHVKYNDSAYLLEPDLKNSPGGLRDLHHIKWFCLQYLGTNNYDCLLKKNILNSTGIKMLRESEKFLAWSRYALHIINQKDDNRLFFDRQLLLARQFGIKRKAEHNAIEAFMKLYFIHVKKLRAVHEIIVNYFYEALFLKDIPIQVLNEQFELKGDLINLKAGLAISENHALVFEAFLVLARTGKAVGFTAGTLVQIHESLNLIDGHFRKNRLHQQLFMELFRQFPRVFNTLQQMNRHQVLGRYLREFQHIIGQTQHDLFHLYTVDQHTLLVIKKIDLLQQEEGLFKELFDQLPRPELLYLAALFHDIGKGRNTSHSIYGSNAALDFAKQHHLNPGDAKLIAWLVKEHLLLSHTAQKKDFHDQNVLRKFAKQVKTIARLDYLYLLTVADIQATNENLWNSWKDSLLKQLYFLAKNHLGQMPAITPTMAAKQAAVLQRFQKYPENQKKVALLWHALGDEYLQKEHEDHIFWHTSRLIEAGFPNIGTLVCTQNRKEHGATEIFICHRDRDNLFAHCALLIDQLGLNIVEARIFTSSNGFSLNTFSVLDPDDHPIKNAGQLRHIEQYMAEQLGEAIMPVKFQQRRISRQLAHFTHKIRIHFHSLPRVSLSELTIHSSDRPGLLARIGRAFYEHGIRVHRAKIMTLGDQVEDMFYITDLENKPLKNRQQQIKLQKRILFYLTEGALNESATVRH